jgi:hypothetical protein
MKNAVHAAQEDGSPLVKYPQLIHYTPLAYSRIVDVPMTVVETPEFLHRSEGVFGPEERAQMIQFVGSYPETGELIPGAGGVRKLRWAVPGKGKRGGARVIYYFHSLRMPVVLITVFRKNEKADLTPAEKKKLRNAVDELVTSFLQRKEEKRGGKHERIKRARF